MDIFPSLRKSLYARIPWVRGNIMVSLLLNAGAWVTAYMRVEPSVEPVPLHISIYFGTDFTAPFWYYYLFPAGGLIITIAHIFIGRIFFRSEPIVSFVILTASSLIQCVVFGVVVLLTGYLS